MKSGTKTDDFGAANKAGEEREDFTGEARTSDKKRNGSGGGAVAKPCGVSFRSLEMGTELP